MHRGQKSESYSSPGIVGAPYKEEMRGSRGKEDRSLVLVTELNYAFTNFKVNKALMPVAKTSGSEIIRDPCGGTLPTPLSIIAPLSLYKM